jgi:hypothetical protein
MTNKKLVKCSKCNEEKPAKEFGPEKMKKNGLRSECRECQRQRARAYRKKYYRKNKAKVKAYQQDRYIGKKNSEDGVLLLT